MVICLVQNADLHMAQLLLLPLTVFCFSKMQVGFTFLVPAYPGSPGQHDETPTHLKHYCSDSFEHTTTVLCPALALVARLFPYLL